MVLEKRYRIILSSAQSSITTREPSQSNSPTRSGSPPALPNNRQLRSGLLSLTCELPSASYWYTKPSTSRPTQKSSMKIREKEAYSANSGLFLQSYTKGLFLAYTSLRMGRRTRHPPKALTAPVIKQLSRSSKSCVRNRKIQCCMFHSAKYSCGEGPSNLSRLLHRPTSHSVSFPPSSQAPSRNLNCTSLCALATFTLPRHFSPSFHSSRTALCGSQAPSSRGLPATKTALPNWTFLTTSKMISCTSMLSHSSPPYIIQNISKETTGADLCAGRLARQSRACLGEEAGQKSEKIGFFGVGYKARRWQIILPNKYYYEGQYSITQTTRSPNRLDLYSQNDFQISLILRLLGDCPVSRDLFNKQYPQ